MSKEMYYLVFRSYSKKERPDPNDRNFLYGWSQSKNVVLAFLEQRSHKKYMVKKMHEDMVSKVFTEDLGDQTMINFVELRSAKTNEKYRIFVTPVELNEAEKKIQRLFREASSLSEVAGDDLMKVLELFNNLDDYYASALFFLGFRPPELDALFPSADSRDDYSDTSQYEDSIDDGYFNGDCDIPGMTPVAPAVVEDVSKQIIYSLESFIKVLKDDM